MWLVNRFPSVCNSMSELTLICHHNFIERRFFTFVEVALAPSFSMWCIPLVMWNVNWSQRIGTDDQRWILWFPARFSSIWTPGTLLVKRWYPSVRYCTKCQLAVVYIHNGHSEIGRAYFRVPIILSYRFKLPGFSTFTWWVNPSTGEWANGETNNLKVHSCRSVLPSDKQRNRFGLLYRTVLQCAFVYTYVNMWLWLRLVYLPQNQISEPC